MEMVKATVLAVAATLATVSVLFARFDPELSVPIGWWARASAVYGDWVLRAQQTATACSGMYAMCGAWLLSAQVMMKAYSGTYVMYAAVTLASSLLLGAIGWYVVKHRVFAVNPDVWDRVKLSFHRGAGSFGHLYVLLAQLNLKAGFQWVIDTVYHLLVCVFSLVRCALECILALFLGQVTTASHRQFIHMFMHEVRVGVSCNKVAEGCLEYNEAQRDPATSDTKLTEAQFAALIRPTLLTEHAEAFRVCQHPVATDKNTPAPLPVPVNFEDYMRLDETQVGFKRRFDAFNAQQEQERHAWPELSHDAYLRFVNVTVETKRGLPAMIDRPDAALYAGGKVHKLKKFVRNYPGVDAMEIDAEPAAAAPAAAGGAGAADGAAAAAPAGPAAAGVPAV